MKTFLASALCIAALASGFACAGQPDAPHEFEFSDLDNAYGTVEQVEHQSARADVIEEKPHAALVRLEDGRTVSVSLEPLQQLHPGERVQLTRGPKGARARPVFRL